MKKSNFVALILGTIGIVFFALGMCMCMLPEWGMFRQGIVCGVIGLVVLLITLLIWRRMEGKAPIKLSAKTTMLVARATVLVIAVISIFLAWDPNSSVFRVVSFAWAGFGAAFGPVVLFALFWKRSNKWGALAGMVSGGVMVFVWKSLIAPMGDAWSIYELLPAFIVASVAIVVVSLLTPAPEKAIVDEFEAVRGK